MSEKLKRLEIFIGIWKYLVWCGKKVDKSEYPPGGILESDADVLSSILDDEAREVIEDVITKDEKRFTAWITNREFKEFLVAIDADRIPIEDLEDLEYEEE